MLKVDTRGFTRNLTATQKAMAAATGRTVLSQSLAGKDFTLQAIKTLDRPTPFMLRNGAYQARKPKTDGAGVISSRLEIGAIQSAVLQWAFFGGTRKPGDAGTNFKRMLLPTDANKDGFGGVPKSLLKRLMDKKIAKGTNGDYTKKAPFYGPAGANGKRTWGVWMRPARTKRVTNEQATIIRERRSGGNDADGNWNKILIGFGQRDARGRFLSTGLSSAGAKDKHTGVRKDLRVKAKGKLVLLIRSEQITNYGSRIDYPDAMNQAANKGADGYDRRFAEEMAMRGLTKG
jgi:hypothetical protein